MIATVHRRAWLWVPGLWLTAVAAQFGPVRVWPALLAIPLAAMLGAHLGRRGLWLAALGLWPLLPPAASVGPWTKIAALDVGVVALAVCALAAQQRPLAERLPRLPGPAALALSLVLLPVAFVPWGTEVGGPGGWRLSLAIGFVAIFHYLLFLTGWRGIAVGRTAGVLALATVAGMWLETVMPADGRALFGGPAAELPLVGMVRLHHLTWDYRLDTPAAWITALGWLGAGRLWARLLATRTVPLAPPVAYAVVVGLSALALGSLLNRQLLDALGLDSHALPRAGILLGSAHALPLAGLTAGLLLAGRGVGVAVAAVLAFWAIDAWLSDFAMVSLPLHEPLVAAGFALVGTRMHEHALGRAIPWATRRWVLVGAIVVLALTLLVESKGAADLALRGIGLAAAGVAALAMAALRRRFDRAVRLDAQAWLTLLAVALFAALLAGQVPTIAGVVADLLDTGVGELWEDITRAREETFVVTMLLALLGLVAWAVEQFVRSGRAALDDVAAWTNAAVLARWSRAAAWARLAAGARWMRIAAFAAATLPFAATVVHELYPDDGLLAAVRGALDRSGETARSPPPAVPAPRPAAHPLLWQAALEAVEGYPLAEADADRGLVVTGWKIDPQTPHVRTKVRIRVGTELASYALDVDLVRHRRGPLGIWVEQDRYWDTAARQFAGYSIEPEKSRLGNEIVARAMALDEASRSKP
jgi:hypothetical protein